MRKFIVPKNASDEDSALNDFMSTFGIQQSEPEPEPEPEVPTQDSEVPEEQPEEKPEVEQKAEVNSKSANAFAQMRIENKKYQTMLNNIAGVLGVKSSKPEEVFQALQDKVTSAQAQQQGISPEVMQRLAMLEQQNSEYALQEARKNAYIGFQKVKDTFGLDNNALNAFADELVATGLNPFEQQVDVLTEYKIRNYDKLIKEAEERGARMEAERSAKASSKSSAPDAKRGSDVNDDVKISSISDLNSWFEKHK